MSPDGTFNVVVVIEQPSSSHFGFCLTSKVEQMSLAWVLMQCLIALHLTQMVDAWDDWNMVSRASFGHLLGEHLRQKWKKAKHFRHILSLSIAYEDTHSLCLLPPCMYLKIHLTIWKMNIQLILHKLANTIWHLSWSGIEVPQLNFLKGSIIKRFFSFYIGSNICVKMHCWHQVIKYPISELNQ